MDKPVQLPYYPNVSVKFTDGGKLTVPMTVADLDAFLSSRSVTTETGSEITGKWSNGHLEHATIKYVCGDTYVGGTRDGDGLMVFAMKEGRGTYTWSDGQHFTGYWINDKQVHGTHTYANGHTWTGSWDNNQQNGAGKLVRVDGVIVTGNWIKGNICGDAEITLTTGEKCMSEWKNGMQIGNDDKDTLIAIVPMNEPLPRSSTYHK